MPTASPAKRKQVAAGKPSSLPLILGIGLPLLVLILLILFAVVIPNMVIKPAHKILYSSGSYYLNDFSVQNEQIRWKCSRPGTTECANALDTANLYVHDFADNSNTQITYEEAQGLRLSATDVSPDGYRYSSYGRQGDYGFFPLFWGSSGRSGPSVQKGMFSKELDLQGTPYYYRAEFVGWILI